MKVTDVRLRLVRDDNAERLRAFATITFDHEFVVRDLKVIEGKEHVFIAMPSRKLRFACPKCSFKNEIESHFCNKCGVTLPLVREEDLLGSQDLKLSHRDIAHPITKDFREYLHSRILEAYRKESSSGRKPAWRRGRWFESMRGNLCRTV